MKPLKKLSSFIDAIAIPSHISGKFRTIDKSDSEAIRDLLVQKYFARSTEGYLSTPQGQKDLSDHAGGRLRKNRSFVIPWLDEIKRLEGSRILEIGCGTGSSTVALAEQGAHVTAVDINSDSLDVAAERCKVYGLRADFVNANATEIHTRFKGQHFDFIIFYASLEHMVYEERLEAMTQTWEMLPTDSLWCVVDSPNRLWYYDTHTSLLPFYHWLPDNLAFDYSRYSPRASFKDEYRERSGETLMHFLRRGREVSFHEFELALGHVGKLHIEDSLSCHQRRRNPLRWLKWRLSFQCRYESMLRKILPGVHRGFYEPSLNLALRKGSVH